MSKELTVVIDADSISYLEHDTREPLIDGGETRRASWVVPANPLKRVAFRVIRAVVGDHGKVAQWCRDWRGPWVVDLRPSDGPVVSGFSCRESALRFEESWVMRSLQDDH